MTPVQIAQEALRGVRDTLRAHGKEQDVALWLTVVGGLLFCVKTLRPGDSDLFTLERAYHAMQAWESDYAAYQRKHGEVD